MPELPMKAEFHQIMGSKPQRANTFQLPRAKYDKLINEVKIAKRGIKKENRHYWLLKRYDVITINKRDKLIAPIVLDRVLYYACLDEVFDILYNTHESIAHGGRDKMRKELKQRYKNITTQDIQIFLRLCQHCKRKKTCVKKEIDIKPEAVPLHFNARCNLHLLDYQSQPDGEFKFVLVYQECITKFVILKALKSNQSMEVAEKLLDIFLLFGTPSMLESSNGLIFVNDIIENLKTMWPELTTMATSHRTNDTQDGDGTKDVRKSLKNMLNRWMQQKQYQYWSKGLGFVQFMHNRVFHAGIEKSPYEAMFGRPSQVHPSITSSSLSSNIFQDIHTDVDLDKLLFEKNS